MARQFLTPRLNRLYRDATVSLINDFSKRSVVYVIQIIWTECPNCVVDSRDGSSTGIYKDGGPKPFENTTCPVCEGKGKTFEEKRTRLQANVQWGPTTNSNPAVTQGRLEEGQLRLKVEYRYHKLLAELKDEDYFLVDDKRCKMEGEPKPRGLQDYVASTIVLRVEK